MNIVRFGTEHMKAAMKLALENYEEEQKQVTCLPEKVQIPELKFFAESGLGVATIEQDKLVGFLCCCPPREHMFDTAAKGVFSPIHAHGAVKKNRKEIYQRMYQTASELLVQKGITYHGISIYTHDMDAVQAFFEYDFGSRCVDAVRSMEGLGLIMSPDIQYVELSEEEKKDVQSLRKMLSDHMGASHCFMYTSDVEFESWLMQREQQKNRVFAAKDGEKIIAYLELIEEGETFVTQHPDMANIGGTFCLPEYRGRGIYAQLIQYTAKTLQTEGYQYFGTDYESMNATANAFWPKHFTPYTRSLTRRIDEGILRKYQG